MVGGWLIRASAVARRRPLSTVLSAQLVDYSLLHVRQWCTPGQPISGPLPSWGWLTPSPCAAGEGRQGTPAGPGKATLWINLTLSVREAEAWWRVR